MKATGVVRRIDELGRIVIPKEIRKTLRIKDGENLEIYIDKESIVLKKYSVMNNLIDLAQDLTDSIYSMLKNNVLITDLDTVIAASGNLKRQYLGKNISEQFEQIILKRESVVENNKMIKIVGEEIKTNFVSEPIIANGDAIGLVCMLSDQPIDQASEQFLKIISSFLSKHLEQ